jgi:hypothetical protein
VLIFQILPHRYQHSDGGVLRIGSIRISMGRARFSILFGTQFVYTHRLEFDSTRIH